MATNIATMIRRTENVELPGEASYEKMVAGDAAARKLSLQKVK